MKKTMFITSVIMVVVMAIALTTSSLAWFSAGGQSNVTTQSFKVTAFAGTSEGIEIGRYHDDTQTYTWGEEIALSDDGSTGLYPVVPFTKKTSNLSADDLLVTLVGGTEGVGVTKAQFIEDYTKYLAWVERQDEVDAHNNTDPAPDETWVNEEPVATYANIYAAYDAKRLIEGTPENAFGTLSVEVEPEDRATASYNKLCELNYFSADTIGTAAAQTKYTAYMIGNKFDNNGKFIDSVYRDGYYTDTFYIRNTSSGKYDQTTGKGAKPILLSVDVSFNHTIWYGTDTDQPSKETFEYTRALRGPMYDTDATLCVAVLAKVSEFDTDMVTYLDEHNSVGDGWEIIGYADSKHWKGDALTTGNISMGKAADNFKLGAKVAECLGYITKDGLNKTSSEVLRPEREYTLDADDLDAANKAFFGESYATLAEQHEITPFDKKPGDTFGNGDDEPATAVTLPADIKTIKVVAWYEGSSLINTNAENANIEFALKFNLENVPAEQQNP